MALEDTAFADESGTEGGSHWCILAGYVASPRQWERFNTRWAAALGNIPAFHSKEFFQRASWKSHSSPYYGWTHEQGHALLARLLDLIDGHLLRPIGCVIDVDALNALPDDDFRRYITGGLLQTTISATKIATRLKSTGAPSRPYMAGMRVLIQDAVDHARPSATVRFIFDKNTDVEGIARESITEMHRGGTQAQELNKRVVGPSFEPDERHAGLQAADLYAYIWNVGLSGKRLTSFHEAAGAVLFRKRAGLGLLDAAEFAKNRESVRQHTQQATMTLLQWHRAGRQLNERPHA